MLCDVAVSRSEPLAVVVGRNCSRIRTAAGITQDVLAMHGRRAGLRWTASKVGDFERGRAAPTFATVLAACSALSAATGTDVTLEDLVASDGFVVLTDRLDPKGAVLVAIVRGERSWRRLRVKDVGYSARTAPDSATLARQLTAAAEQMRAESARYPWLDDAPLDAVTTIQERSGLYEDRLAKRLGISRGLLAAFSWQLWRRSFSAERDERAGPDANAQTRGRISRILQTELRTQLEKVATDGDDQ